LRRYRQAGRRPDPRPHLDQRVVAGLTDARITYRAKK
jgi:hypothetical protein